MNTNINLGSAIKKAETEKDSFYHESPNKRMNSNNFNFNLKKFTESEIKQSSSSKVNSNKPVVNFQDDYDFMMSTSLPKNVFFNNKKITQKNKCEKINESDIILKNDELKAEFLNENNFVLENKSYKYPVQNTKHEAQGASVAINHSSDINVFSNSVNNINNDNNTNTNYIQSAFKKHTQNEKESRRMVIELVKYYC